MNLRKGLLALFLCFAVVLCLFFFSDSSFSSLSERDLRGQWTTSVPAANYVENALSGMLDSQCHIEEDLQLTYIFEYHADGRLTLKMDESSGRAMIEILKKTMTQAMPDAFYAQFEKSEGMDRAAVDALLASQGTDIQTLVADSIASTDFDGLLQRETTELTMYYRLREGKLYYASTPETLDEGLYELCVEPVINGRMLTLTNAIDAEGNPFEGSATVKYPLTLHKK